MPSVRTGKTEKDRKSGATQRNADNKRARVNYYDSVDARGHTDEQFPRSSCNGQKNRFRYTGKGNRLVTT